MKNCGEFAAQIYLKDFSLAGEIFAFEVLNLWVIFDIMVINTSLAGVSLAIL
jgi:hypothetical protein